LEPHVWLYQKDLRTYRIVQRPAETGSEVLIMGPDGIRTHQTFKTAADADRFRSTLTRRIVAKGFTLAWGSTDPS
jgi:hypothetical protein